MPVSSSCRLYTGCHLGSKQISPRLIPQTSNLRGFGNTSQVHDASSVRFTFVHLLDTHMTPWRTPFPKLLTTMIFWTTAALGSLRPVSAHRSRGAYPHHQCGAKLRSLQGEDPFVCSRRTQKDLDTSTPTVRGLTIVIDSVPGAAITPALYGAALSCASLLKIFLANRAMLQSPVSMPTFRSVSV